MRSPIVIGRAVDVSDEFSNRSVGVVVNRASKTLKWSVLNAHPLAPSTDLVNPFIFLWDILRTNT